MAKLNVGDTMPNFTFNTAFESGLQVKDVVKKADRTIFWVLRYIGCTVCRYDVHVLAGLYKDFQAKGVQLYVVMQSDPEVVKNDLKDVTLPFDIICDTDMNIYKSLEIGSFTGISDESMKKLVEKAGKAEACGFTHGKYEGNEQQLPALFMTDKEGKVIYAHYAEDIMDMPTPAEMLASL